MNILIGIRLNYLLVLAGLITAAGIGYKYYMIVKSQPTSTVSSSVTTPPALASSAASARSESLTTPPAGSTGNGQTLDVTASYDAAEGGSVSWVRRADACNPIPVLREHFLTAVQSSQASVKSWTICLPSTSGEPVTSSKVWFSTDAGSSYRPEGAVLLVPFQPGSKVGEHFFMTAGGLCVDEDRPCMANLQIGVTQYPSRLSMALSMEGGVTQYFVLERPPRKSSVKLDYDEILGEAAPLEEAELSQTHEELGDANY